MGISFGKRKLKIKIIGNEESKANKAPKEQIPVIPIKTERTIKKADLKVKRTFKEVLNEITKVTISKMNLSDFTAYQYYYSDNRYQFNKVTGNSILGEIELEKHLSVDEPTIIRRATGLSEAQEYRSRLIILYGFENKDYIFIWSSILYEAR
jgi:hypothetical protein